MPERRIIWTHRFQIELTDILTYYKLKNGSCVFAVLLFNLIRKEVGLITRHPEAGKRTEFADVRALIVRNFTIYYSFSQVEVIILSIWDNRRNPDALELKI